MNRPAIIGHSGGKYVRVSRPPAPENDEMQVFTMPEKRFQTTRPANR